MKNFPNHSAVSELARRSALGMRPSLFLAPNQQTAVPQSTANAAAQINNPAYKGQNFNDYGPFDTMAITRNLQEYGFFTQSIGQNGKTKFDTNMVTGSQFPLGRNVVVKGIGFHFFLPGLTLDSVSAGAAEAIQAFYTIMENSYLEVVIQGRQFEFQAPGTYWLPEVALANQVSLQSTSTQSSTSYQRMGDYIKHGGYKLAQPITLQNLVPWQLNWYVNLQNPAVTAAVTTLTPDGLAAAKLRWQFLGTLQQEV